VSKAYWGVERDIKRLDPLLFIKWDIDRDRWVIRRKHRTWHHGPLDWNASLSWYSEDDVTILVVAGPNGEYRDPGVWLLPILHSMDTQRFRRTKANDRGNADLHKEMEENQRIHDEKRSLKFKDDLGCITREAWNKATETPVVHIPEKVA